MSTPKHTPGPWVVTEHSSGMICVAGPDNKDLCAVGYNRTNGRDDVANASLIAAAPAMYEALLLAVQALEELAQHPAFEGEAEEFNDSGYGYSALNKAQTALAQAEGK